MYEPITVDVNTARHRREHHHPDRGERHRRRVERCATRLRDEIVPADRRRRSEHGSRRHRADGPVEGRSRRAEVDPAAGRRVRPPVRVRADAGRVPLDRDRGQGDRPQPALGGRRLRHARARLPARRRQGPARRQLRGRDRGRGAAAPVRDPVRPLDGLPRVHHQPDPRGVESRGEHRRGDPARHQVHGRRRHERSDRHGLRVRGLRHALDAVLQAVRCRARGGDPDRRDDRPRGAAAGVDEAARRLELVPAEVARVAPAARLRRARSRAGGRECAHGRAGAAGDVTRKRALTPGRITGFLLIGLVVLGLGYLRVSSADAVSVPAGARQATSS